MSYTQTLTFPLVQDIESYIWQNLLLNSSDKPNDFGEQDVQSVLHELLKIVPSGVLRDYQDLHAELSDIFPLALRALLGTLKKSNVGANAKKRLHLLKLAIEALPPEPSQVERIQAAKSYAEYLRSIRLVTLVPIVQTWLNPTRQAWEALAPWSANIKHKNLKEDQRARLQQQVHDALLLRLERESSKSANPEAVKLALQIDKFFPRVLQEPLYYIRDHVRLSGYSEHQSLYFNIHQVIRRAEEVRPIITRAKYGIAASHVSEFEGRWTAMITTVEDHLDIGPLAMQIAIWLQETLHTTTDDPQLVLRALGIEPPAA